MGLPASLDLAHLGIAVVHARDRDGEALIRQLQRLGGQPIQYWPMPERLDRGYDLLFCVVDGNARNLTLPLIESGATTVIGIADPANANTPLLLANMGPHGVLLRPIDGGALAAGLIVAHMAARHHRRLLGKLAKLEERLRTVREVHRAKTILMEKRRLDEPGAFALLREQAMRRRVPIGVIANLVVAANEALSDETDLIK
jgi:AmiR/NasT family two-component response regulator